MLAASLDFRTLLLVYVATRIIDAVALAYVWRVHRGYAPARLWALGSAVVSAGALVAALRGTIPLDVSILVGNALVFAGMVMFSTGIRQIDHPAVSFVPASVVAVLAFSAMAFYTVVEASITLRVVFFSLGISVLGAMAGIGVLRRGRRDGIRLALGCTLLVEPVFLIVRAIGAFTAGMANDGMTSNGYQAFFVFGLICSALMMTLELAFLTNQMDNARRAEAERTLWTETERSARLAGVLDTALQNMSQGLAMFGPDGGLITCNDKYMGHYDLTARDVEPGMKLHEIARLRVGKGIYRGSDPEAYVEERKALAARMMSEPTDRWAELNNGRTIRINSRPLPSGGWVMTNEDITEQKRRDDEITHLARHDILTGLVNRSRFHAVVAETTAAQPRFNVLMLDLDRFKQVNDSLGHAAGDALLKEVARRLKDAVRAGDVVARLGGDEFAIVQPMPRSGEAATAEHSRAAATALAERILAAFNEPVDIDGCAVFAAVSIGAALSPDHGRGGSALLKNADFALYAAKSAGRGTYRLFDPAMAAAADAQVVLEAELRLALERGEFELVYQPIVEIASGRPVMHEALVRWRHPRRGLLAPGEFLRVAEDSGLIIPLGEWVLHRACQDAMAWPEELRLAVNVSTAQLRKSNLIDVVLFALADTGLAPERLEVEVTESVLHGDEADGLDTLHRLKALGVAIALDDFGTGHSALGYLSRFRFDRIKIDRAFVASIVENPDSMAIVGAVGGLVRQLDMAAVAEGVETAEQLEVLRAAGVAFAQGYLLGRPQPASTLVHTLAECAVGAA